MLTVFEVYNQYCQDHELPPPTQKDLQNAGGLIGTHFRRFWGLQNPDEVKNAGFKLSPREGCLVIGYPESFLIEMYRRIGHYRQMKQDKMNKAIEKPTDPSPPKIASEPRKRNRIKTQTPAYSGKPLLKK